MFLFLVKSIFHSHTFTQNSVFPSFFFLFLFWVFFPRSRCWFRWQQSWSRISISTLVISHSVMPVLHKHITCKCHVRDVLFINYLLYAYSNAACKSIWPPHPHHPPLKWIRFVWITNDKQIHVFFLPVSSSQTPRAKVFAPSAKLQMKDVVLMRMQTDL